MEKYKINLDEFEDLVDMISIIDPKNEKYVILENKDILITEENFVDLLSRVDSYVITAPEVGASELKQSIFHLACKYGLLSIIELCCCKELKEESFPLHIAVEFSQYQAVELLLQLECNPNLKDKDGNPAIFYCSSVETAQLLVNSGAIITQEIIRDYSDGVPDHRVLEYLQKNSIERVTKRRAIASEESDHPETTMSSSTDGEYAALDSELGILGDNNTGD